MLRSARKNGLCKLPDSRDSSAQRWTNVSYDVGPTLVDDVGPMTFCSSALCWPNMLAKHWPNVVNNRLPIKCHHLTNVSKLVWCWSDVGPTLSHFYADVGPTLGIDVGPISVCSSALRWPNMLAKHWLNVVNVRLPIKYHHLTNVAKLAQRYPTVVPMFPLMLALH